MHLRIGVPCAAGSGGRARLGTSINSPFPAQQASKLINTNQGEIMAFSARINSPHIVRVCGPAFRVSTVLCTMWRTLVPHSFQGAVAGVTLSTRQPQVRLHRGLPPVPRKNKPQVSVEMLPIMADPAAGMDYPPSAFLCIPKMMIKSPNLLANQHCIVESGS